MAGLTPEEAYDVRCAMDDCSAKIRAAMEWPRRIVACGNMYDDHLGVHDTDISSARGAKEDMEVLRRIAQIHGLACRMYMNPLDPENPKKELRHTIDKIFSSVWDKVRYGDSLEKKETFWSKVMSDSFADDGQGGVFGWRPDPTHAKKNSPQVSGMNNVFAALWVVLDLVHSDNPRSSAVSLARHLVAILQVSVLDMHRRVPRSVHIWSGVGGGISLGTGGGWSGPDPHVHHKPPGFSPVHATGSLGGELVEELSAVLADIKNYRKEMRAELSRMGTFVRGVQGTGDAVHEVLMQVRGRLAGCVFVQRHRLTLV
jgi:hypothetical protein